MKNKLIFRILGALASALIIVSVFVPFVSVTGYSPSLWETYELTNSLYLPIMIIVFGAIGIIFFALNIKTEFAYMSVGAIFFFAVMQTIDILDQGVFNTLSIGYYFLVIGALLTGIMAFLTNLKSKNKVEVVEEGKKEEEASMIDQIDKLYNEQTSIQSEISPIQPVDSVVQPLPIQPLEAVLPVQPIEQAVEQVQVNPVVQEIPTEQNEVVQEPIAKQNTVENEQPINPVLQEFNVPKVEENEVVQEQPIAEPSTNQPVNPVLQEFAVPSTPVVEETQPVQEQPTNPVLQDFAQPNPVLQEFGISNSSVVQEQPIVEQPVLNQEVASVPLTNINEPVPSNPVVEDFNNQGSIISIPQSNPSELDIFGQPINKS